MNLRRVEKLQQEVRTLEGILSSNITKGKITSTDEKVIKNMIIEKDREIELNYMQD
tara:strand:+ start:35684 stop:35851 length:168 start_codon:yes stop_codon:yes gene_type:complete